MSAVQEAVESVGFCVCGSIGESPENVRFCEECHRYWRGDKELISVSKVLRSTWPFKPDFSKAPPGVIENARDRGIEVDRMFTRYLQGNLKVLRKDEYRKDAVALFLRLKRWWDERKHGDVSAQVILADNDMAGMCDVIDGDWVYDLKTTYNIEPMYHLQLGLYASLHYETFKRPVKGIGIIHVSERFPTPKLIKLDAMECAKDAMLLRDAYFMAVRRTA